MSNNTSIQALLNAVSNAVRPFSALENASKNLKIEIQQTQEGIAALDEQLAQVSRFRQSSRDLAATRQQLQAAKADTAALALAFKNSANPTRQQAAALDEARKSVSALQIQSGALRLSLQQQRQALLAADIAPRNLARAQQQLKQSAAQANLKMVAQQQTLQQTTDRQDKLNQTRERYRKGQALAGQIRSGSSMVLDVAKSGVQRAASLLRPGYAFAEASSQLQSTLGLENNAPQLQALQAQARSLSHSGSFSAIEVVQQQLALAQAGSSADEILAQTPAALTKPPAGPAAQAGSASVPRGLTAPDSAGGNLKALQSAYSNISIDLYDKLDGSLRTLTQDATQFLLLVDGWIQKNPVLASGMAQVAMAGVIFIGALGTVGSVVAPLITGVNLLMAGAGMLGSVFSVVGGAIATVLGGLTLPIVAVVTAVIAGALIIRKFWEPISAFIGGVAQGFSAAMGPIADAFAPLQPVFSWLGDRLKMLWDGFGRLLEPVKLTQSELASAGELGRKFGTLLADALKIPGEALNQLRGGIDWVLQKLGVIDSKSDNLKNKVPSPDAMATGGAGVDSSGPRYDVALGGATYRPLPAASASAGITDNSQHSYQYEIHLPPGVTKEDVQTIIERDRASQARQQWANRYGILSTGN